MRSNTFREKMSSILFGLENYAASVGRWIDEAEEQGLLRSGRG